MPTMFAPFTQTISGTICFSAHLPLQRRVWPYFRPVNVLPSRWFQHRRRIDPLLQMLLGGRPSASAKSGGERFNFTFSRLPQVEVSPRGGVLRPFPSLPVEGLTYPCPRSPTPTF